MTKTHANDDDLHKPIIVIYGKRSRGEAEEISVEGPMSKKRKLPTFNAKVPKCPRVKHNAQRAEGLIQKTSVEHALVKST